MWVSFQQIIGEVALTIASVIVYVVNPILFVLLLLLLLLPECATQNALTLAPGITNPVVSFGAGIGNKVKYLYYKMDHKFGEFTK